MNENYFCSGVLIIILLSRN